ncbi:very short patch repair endonuclease [Micromonospora chokoriensis]
MDTAALESSRQQRLSPSSAGRSRNLSAIRRTNTKPEVLLRSLLHARGLRFRKDFLVRLPPSLKARPDVAFTRLRVALFYDSCFWHSCPKHGRQPRVNQWYWRPKLARTAERDRIQAQALRGAGWLVIRIWEHDDLLKAVDDVVEIIAARRQELAS